MAVTKRQTNSLMGGNYIVCTMGFYLAWDTFVFIHPDFIPLYGLPISEITHLLLCWHLAFLIGSTLGAFFVQNFWKSTIYYTAGALTIASGALLIVSSSGTIVVLIIARYLGGIAQGLAFITVIIHAAEIAVTKHRGLIIAEISLHLAASLALAYVGSAILEFAFEESQPINIYFGCLIILFSLSGLIRTRWKTFESSVFLLQNNKLDEARDNLSKLRYECSSSWVVTQELDDFQSMLKYEEQQSVNIFGDGNLLPLFRVTILRGAFAIANLAIMNVYGYVFLSTIAHQYGLVVVYLCRLITECICMLRIDKWGRLIFLLISCLGCAISMTVIGCISFIRLNETLISVSGVMYILFGLSVGLGLGPVTMVYMGEAFSIKKKPFSVLFVLFVERLINIIGILCYFYIDVSSTGLFITNAIILLLCTVLILPNTNNRSLRETVDIVKNGFLKKNFCC